jgi:hypothetical protein
MLGEPKCSLLQRLKVTHSARNTGSNAIIKTYQELPMIGEYILKLTDKTADSVPKGLDLVFYKTIPSITDKCFNSTHSREPE